MAYSDLNQHGAGIKRVLGWLALSGMIIASLAVVAIPVMLIRPFQPQTTRSVEISFLLKSWSPLATMIALIISLGLAAWLWRMTRAWLSKGLIILSFAPLIVATWFARQNHFEWMFNPVSNTAFATTNQVTTVSDEDMVLAVTINGESVAYPVRQLAYHHLVHDTVGGVPIVATY